MPLSMYLTLTCVNSKEKYDKSFDFHGSGNKIQLSDLVEYCKLFILNGKMVVTFEYVISFPRKIRENTLQITSKYAISAVSFPVEWPLFFNKLSIERTIPSEFKINQCLLTVLEALR